MEYEGRHPEFYNRRTADVLFDIIKEAGSSGISLLDATKYIDEIRERQTRHLAASMDTMPKVIEPGVPGFEEMNAIVKELIDSGKVVLEAGRLFSLDT